MNRCLACLLALAAPAAAQNLVTYDLAAGTFMEGAGTSPLYPGAGIMLNVYPTFAPLPPAGPMLGAMTIDGTNGMTWYSNGPVIAANPHNAYPAGAPPIPPFPGPPVIGAISGMAIDPAGAVLWLTDGVMIVGTAPVPGAPVIVPPFAPAFPVPIPPLTGLDWDPITGTLWGCDAAGMAYNFAPGGPPAGAPLPPPMPLPGPATGIAIDKTGLAFGAGRSIYLLSGGAILDIATGVFFPSFGGGMDAGIAFHPVPNPAPIAPCPCPSPGYAIGQALRGPSVVGNANFGVDLTGLPPGTPVAFAFDFFGFNPAFPVLNGLGCPLGLNLGTMFIVPGAANAAGTAALPIPLTRGVRPGLQFYMQYITLCPADPLGVILTPMYQVTVALP